MALSDDELQVLLVDLESDRVERKQSLDVDRACQAICAFSNDLPDRGLPGVLFVGADDAGRPVGRVTDRLLLDLAGLRDRGTVLPLPTLSVRALDVGGQRVAVVEVQPSLTPPVRYRGVVWVRVGPRRAVASPDEERRLSERRRSLDLPFDASPVVGTSQEDLDLDLARSTYLPAAVAPEVLAENHRSLTEQLTSVRLLDPSGVATAAGLLLVGRQPHEVVPGAWVQVLRLDGEDLSAPVLDEQRLEGPLVRVLRSVDELLRVNVRTRVDVAATPERRQEDFPLVALQQLVRNAVMHRSYEATSAPTRVTWYDDRVEIWSPGGPFGVVTRESFGTPGVTDYRNPTLADAMRALGYVQRFGVGLAVAARACRDQGGPPPEYAVEAEFVAATVRRTW